MDRPILKPYEDQAIDMLVNVLNKAVSTMGQRLDLSELTQTRVAFTPHLKVSLASLQAPLAISSEHLLKKIIENKWYLTSELSYVLHYRGCSRNETSHFFYFEAIFSQPTPAYPIPQATASVFFTVEDKHIEPPDFYGVPMITFRIEGQHTDHDIRFVTLTQDWILALIKMKTKFFERIEKMRLI